MRAGAIGVSIEAATVRSRRHAGHARVAVLVLRAAIPTCRLERSRDQKRTMDTVEYPSALERPIWERGVGALKGKAPALSDDLKAA